MAQEKVYWAFSELNFRAVTGVAVHGTKPSTLNDKKGNIAGIQYNKYAPFPSIY
jgi:hypothetical protein